MTGDETQARLLSDRIARRISGASAALVRSPGKPSDDVAAELSAMRATLDNMRQKLVQLETRLSHSDKETRSYSVRADGNGQAAAQHMSSTFAPASHPSQERFGVEEATIAELVDFFEGDKKCELEPGTKPCDHCAACSSRGF